jgi:alpha-L-fucosidase
MLCSSANLIQKSTILLLMGLVAVSFLISCTSKPRYTEDWTSLAKHNEQPNWFHDAKFGIYFHWGVYTVPAYGSEWYPRDMHFLDGNVGKHHLEKYGHPSEFGYHDFVPQFKAEHFDAEQWADLFQKD